MTKQMLPSTKRASNLNTASAFRSAQVSQQSSDFIPYISWIHSILYLNQETVKCLVGDRGLGVASRVVISTARAQAGKGMPTFRSTNGSNHTQKNDIRACGLCRHAYNYTGNDIFWRRTLKTSGAFTEEGNYTIWKAYTAGQSSNVRTWKKQRKWNVQNSRARKGRH